MKKKRLLFVLAFVLLLTLLYRFFAKRIKAIVAQAKEAFKTSEAGRFKALLETLESRDLSQAYRLFYAWLLAFKPELAEEGFKGIGEMYPSFSEALKSFEKVLTQKDDTFDTGKFILSLKEFRKDVLKVKKAESTTLLGRLNP